MRSSLLRSLTVLVACLSLGGCLKAVDLDESWKYYCESNEDCGEGYLCIELYCVHKDEADGEQPDAGDDQQSVDKQTDDKFQSVDGTDSGNEDTVDATVDSGGEDGNLDTTADTAGEDQTGADTADLSSVDQQQDTGAPDMNVPDTNVDDVQQDQQPPGDTGDDSTVVTDTTIDSGGPDTTVEDTASDTILPLTAKPTKPGPVLLGGSVSLIANPSGGSGNYSCEWKLGGNSVGQSCSVSTSPPFAGDLTYSVTVTDNVTKQQATANLAVLVYSITAQASPDQIYRGETTLLSVSSTGIPLQQLVCEWTVSNGPVTIISGTNCSVVVKPNVESEYSLTVTSTVDGKTLYSTKLVVKVAIPSCNDFIVNGNETNNDCGGRRVWINEVLPDSKTGDLFYELAGPAGMSLKGYQLLFYDSNGNLKDAAQFGFGDGLNGNARTVGFLSNSLPAGTALVDPFVLILLAPNGELMDSLAIGATIKLKDGPANGVEVKDIGVSGAEGKSYAKFGLARGSGWKESPPSLGDTNPGQFINPICGPCEDDKPCRYHLDCQSKLCAVDGTCKTATLLVDPKQPVTPGTSLTLTATFTPSLGQVVCSWTSGYHNPLSTSQTCTAQVTVTEETTYTFWVGLNSHSYTVELTNPSGSDVKTPCTTDNDCKSLACRQVLGQAGKVCVENSKTCAMVSGTANVISGTALTHCDPSKREFARCVDGAWIVEPCPANKRFCTSRKNGTDVCAHCVPGSHFCRGNLAQYKCNADGLSATFLTECTNGCMSDGNCNPSSNCNDGEIGGCSADNRHFYQCDNTGTYVMKPCGGFLLGSVCVGHGTCFDPGYRPGYTSNVDSLSKLKLAWNQDAQNPGDYSVTILLDVMGAGMSTSDPMRVFSGTWAIDGGYSDPALLSTGGKDILWVGLDNLRELPNAQQNIFAVWNYDTPRTIVGRWYTGFPSKTPEFQIADADDPIRPFTLVLDVDRAVVVWLAQANGNVMAGLVNKTVTTTFPIGKGGTAVVARYGDGGFFTVYATDNDEYRFHCFAPDGTELQTNIFPQDSGITASRAAGAWGAYNTAFIDVKNDVGGHRLGVRLVRPDCKESVKDANNQPMYLPLTSDGGSFPVYNIAMWPNGDFVAVFQVKSAGGPLIPGLYYKVFTNDGTVRKKATMFQKSVPFDTSSRSGIAVAPLGNRDRFLVYYHDAAGNLFGSQHWVE